MLSSLSIKDLYPLALAEGEGVGTAYEYVAKRLVLQRWLKASATPRRVLIAGLPQKYGASLDFFLLAAELHAELTVADDRPEALAKAQNALAPAQPTGHFDSLRPHFQSVADWTEISGTYDFVVSSEVLQRLTPAGRTAYVDHLGRLAPAGALFAPNAANTAHSDISGLAGIHLVELHELLPSLPNLQAGYIDMPPFPPGITRTDEQREQAETGRAEAFAMWGLGIYARLEKFIPLTIRRRQAHIVYGLWRRP